MLWLWSAAWLAAVALIGCVQMEDGDIWWHLRTGQLIWQRGHLPTTDWFTYTNPDSPWIDLHWGFQLIAAGLWTLGGVPALVLLKSFLGVCTFALLLAARRRRWPAWHSVACMLPSVLVYAGRNQVRPEIFTFLLLAASLCILFHSQARPRLVWLLPLLQVLWINLQGLFVLGLVVWGCWMADRALRRYWTWGEPEPDPSFNWRRAAGVSAGMLLAALVNPYGVAGATFPLTLLARIQGSQRSDYQQFADEFRGLGDFIARYGPGALLGNMTTCMLLSIYLLTAASFIWLLARRRLSLFRLFVFAAFGYLGWQASRNSVLLAIAGGAVLRWNVGELWEMSAARPTAARVGRLATAVALALLLIAAPADVLSLMTRSVSPRRFGLSESPFIFGHDAATFLGRPGMPDRVYALHFDQAAVYMFHNGPQRKVFADGRLEVNTLDTLNRYNEIQDQLVARDPAVLENLSRGPIPAGKKVQEPPALLLDLRSPVWFDGVRHDPRFRAVFVDEATIVFLTVAQAERLNLRALSVNEVEGLAEAARQATVSARR